MIKIIMMLLMVLLDGVKWKLNPLQSNVMFYFDVNSAFSTLHGGDTVCLIKSPLFLTRNNAKKAMDEIVDKIKSLYFEKLNFPSFEIIGSDNLLCTFEDNNLREYSVHCGMAVYFPSNKLIKADLNSLFKNIGVSLKTPWFMHPWLTIIRAPFALLWSIPYNLYYHFTSNKFFEVITITTENSQNAYSSPSTATILSKTGAPGFGASLSQELRPQNTSVKQDNAAPALLAQSSCPEIATDHEGSFECGSVPSFGNPSQARDGAVPEQIKRVL